MKKTLITLLMVTLLLIANNGFAITANSDYQESGTISIDISAYEPAIREYAVGVTRRIMSPIKDLVEYVSDNWSFTTYPSVPYASEVSREGW